MPTKTSEIDEPLHVAVAAIVNERNEVLISRRPSHVHQGGMWEFPGGKLEQGESVLEALGRELKEELGVRFSKPKPLIRIRHKYPERYVDLDVWRIEQLQGTPSGREGQEVEWVAVGKLRERRFPAANNAIIHALQLPSCYLITPEPEIMHPDFFANLEKALSDGVRLVQLRAKRLSKQQFRGVARDVLACCRAQGARLLLNSSPQTVLDVGADGVHLSADQMLRHNARPLDAGHWVAASCHNRRELDLAADIGVDFVVLSPVCSTLSHPNARQLGWKGFASLCNFATVPVYGLGGLTLADINNSRRYGGQGIAAIRGLWPKDI